MNCTLVSVCGICIPGKQQGGCAYQCNCSGSLTAIISTAYRLCFRVQVHPNMDRRFQAFLSKSPDKKSVFFFLPPIFSLINVQYVRMSTSLLQTETGNSNMSSNNLALIHHHYFLSFQWRYYDQSLQRHFYFIVVFTTVKLISQTQTYNLLCKSWWLIINCEFSIVIAEPWYFL